MWFKNLLLKLDTNTSNKKLSNESNFIFSVFQQLELMYPLLGQRINIWRDLTAIAIDRVKNYSENRIFTATKLIVQIKQDNVKVLFLEMTLNVPNMMSEDILYHIMTRLQNQSTASSVSEHYLNALKASNFWNIILRANVNVAKLNSNPFVKNTKTYINELAGLLLEKTIDIQLLQQILEYNDEYLFRHFDAAVAKKKALGDVIVSRDEIAKLRKICNNYQTQLDDWEKLKCSEASLLWTNVTDVNSELDLMGNYKISGSQRFVKTLNNLSKIPQWTYRLKELEKVVKMEIFKVPHNNDDWLTKSIRILKGDSTELGQLNDLFDYLDRNFFNVSQDCWKLIEELSRAEIFIRFLKDIAGHDIENLINGVGDHSDEELIQEDSVSSLIQVKQFLFPLMNKNMETISDFLKELLNVINKDHTLREKIALCNSSNVALRIMYNNIQNRGEVTKEKIKNAVLNGTFTFSRDHREDKCLVSLQYPSKSNLKYNLNEILNLRGQALLIANHKNTVMINSKEVEMSKDVIDKFVAQVDITLEIINLVTMLIQVGHFDYRKFIKELQGTDKMKVYLKSLKEELKKWQDIVDLAQEKWYYLTFFSAHHILSFFASKKGYDKHLFCIVNLELLDIELQFYFVNYFKEMQSKYTNENYLLALLCGRSSYVLDHYSLEVQAINELNAETLRKVYQELFSNITFLIRDNMDFRYLVNKLKKCNLTYAQSLHINILSTDCPEDVNLFLFELLTFRVTLHDKIIVSFPETYIFIEIASMIKQNLLNILPIVSYLPFKHLSWNIKDFKVSQEIASSIQVVCHFLNLYDNGKIDTEEIFSQGSEFIKDPLSEEHINICVNILADQLIKFTSNLKINNSELVKKLGETDANNAYIANIRLTLIELLLNTSKDSVIQVLKANDQLKSSTFEYENEIIQLDNSNINIFFFNSQEFPLIFDKNKVPDNIKLLLESQVPSEDREFLDSYFGAYYMKKLISILLRVNANIPVTSLIAQFALVVEVQFLALNLHAGIDEETIMTFMNDALKKAEKGETWILFYEINTCNHLGLFADLISNKKYKDKPIHPNIRLFATCNPYRFRTGIQSEASKDKQYDENKVKPLPDQILDYVCDYGILNPQDYAFISFIHSMVDDELNILADPVFLELLFASQKFIRKVEERYSNRPIYRKGHTYPPAGNPTIKTRSYVLALSLCYHSRLYDQDLRKQYRHEMEQVLQNYKAYIGENMFARIIREEQEDYINRMQCPPNTAHNEALLENVLVMIVCILTKIPLFLIGASGSSKSLAIRLISSNLRGSDSDDKYFKTLPRIYLISHQSSSSSTPEGVIKVFDKANKFQKTTSKRFPVASVVLLDNVNLTETNPFNPLKVLHSLLEPRYPATELTVSVIGISNLRLDNSKNSRALIVQRPQVNLDDLVDTAECLLNTRVIGH
ncbi:hypothetical protein RhiirA5_505219 [Rhizophagus irregularis]|uniref:Uncharacterized protein n=1 Tax=Rhizophagus irregularis TaxID=588596 RepID=A0A2N0P0K6_9GLOM|nr:hypothetical protein RhiirA5_505219 [Rhizophagus irregularis]